MESLEIVNLTQNPITLYSAPFTPASRDSFDEGRGELLGTSRPLDFGTNWTGSAYPLAMPAAEHEPLRANLWPGDEVRVIAPLQPVAVAWPPPPSTVQGYTARVIVPEAVGRTVAQAKDPILPSWITAVYSLDNSYETVKRAADGGVIGHTRLVLWWQADAREPTVALTASQIAKIKADAATEQRIALGF